MKGLFFVYIDKLEKYIKRNSVILRRIIFISIDLMILSLSSSLIFNNNIKFISIENIFLPLLGLIIYLLSGQYRDRSRYSVNMNIYISFIMNLIITFSYYIFSINFNSQPYYFKDLFLFMILITSLRLFFRVFVRDSYILILNFKSKVKSNIVIYGAGKAGSILYQSLRIDGKFNILAFIDDDNNLAGSTINRVQIQPRNFLSDSSVKIDGIFFAIPSIGHQQKKNILKSLQNYNIPIFIIPSLSDIESNKVSINKLRPIDVEDLLCRDPIYNDQTIVQKVIKGSIVCVTGAGGSIGSEICRQVLKFKPRLLIMIDHSELNLYQIDQELNSQEENKGLIKSVLASVSNQSQLENIFKSNKITLIFHAAAYKHVPLVEANPLSAIYNNIFSTEIICKLAFSYKVKKVILISTDKAVRPKNVMGATKRVAELIFQAYDEKSKQLVNTTNTTCFSMVRFGNVLGSSGSVVPLFRKQIDKGGPLTITHPDIIRYFMTINEAVELVLQTSALSDGGEVFLLDMGEPVEIKALAMQMIKLSGLSIKDKANPNGDIEINYTGLRRGEKLYEELLIDNNTMSTSNPLIYKANERFVSQNKLFSKIDELRDVISEGDKSKSFDILSQLVPEWQRQIDYD